jgi:hypothetical protein
MACRDDTIPDKAKKDEMVIRGEQMLELPDAAARPNIDTEG